MNNVILFIVPGVGLLGLLFSLYLAYGTLKNDPGPPEITTISRAIQVGATTFMRREYRVMGLTALLFAVFLALVLNVYVMFAFLVGVLCSTLSGFVGMSIATRPHPRYPGAVDGDGIIGFCPIVYEDPGVRGATCFYRCGAEISVHPMSWKRKIVGILANGRNKFRPPPGLV